MEIAKNPTAEFFRRVGTDGSFELQVCDSCHKAWHRPRLSCPSCRKGSSGWYWSRASGRGTVYAVTRVEIPAPRFRGQEPYQVALVDLVESPRIMARIVEGEVGIGVHVNVKASVLADAGPEVLFTAKGEI